MRNRESYANRLATGSGAYQRADWRRVDQLYRQFSAIANDPEKENILPDALVGALAESLGRVVAHYDGREKEFMQDVFAVFSEAEGLRGSAIDRFRWLYYDRRLDRFDAYKPSGEGRRRPKPFEATVETCRRLLALNRVRDALISLPTGGILGGSASYGRFFNVCGASTGKSSDVDLLLVVPDYALLPDVAQQLRQVQGVEKNSLALSRKRIAVFEGLRKRRSTCIFSHKLRLWESSQDPCLERYHIPGLHLFSLHAFSTEDFEFMIVKDKPILAVGRKKRFLREIKDYRDTRPMRFDNQRSFSGIDSTVPLVSAEVQKGFISRVRVCHIEHERFFPGLHQNLVLPQFEIRWESPLYRLYLPVLGFRWKILERLREERRLRPFEVQSLSLAHTRSAVFAPHITRRADRE